MGLFGIFSPESSSTTTNIASEYQNSFNKTISSSSVNDNVGNTTLNLGGEASGGSAADKILPIVAITAIGLGLVAMLKGKG